MKVDKDVSFAIGKALRELDAKEGPLQDAGEGAKVASVEVGGENVDLAAARETFDVRAEEAADAAWKLLDKLEGKAEKLQGKLESKELGKKIAKVIDHDPERVSRDLEVEVTFDDGRSLKLPLEVVDLQKTRVLQSASMVSELISLLPVVGPFVAAGTSLASALASLAARALKQPELAESLQDTALKHLVLTGAGFIPVVGSAAPALAAVGDRQDRRELSRHPSVEDVVNLKRAVQQA